MSSPVVGIVVGSESDRPRMQAAVDELEARGIAHELEVSGIGDVCSRRFEVPERGIDGIVFWRFSRIGKSVG